MNSDWLKYHISLQSLKYLKTVYTVSLKYHSNAHTSLCSNTIWIILLRRYRLEGLAIWTTCISNNSILRHECKCGVHLTIMPFNESKHFRQFHHMTACHEYPWHMEGMSSTFINVGSSSLTHWSRDKIATISQMTFSNAFSWTKIHEFRLRFHWILFLKFELIIFQQYFR